MREIDFYKINDIVEKKLKIKGLYLDDPEIEDTLDETVYRSKICKSGGITVGKVLITLSRYNLVVEVIVPNRKSHMGLFDNFHPEEKIGNYIVESLEKIFSEYVGKVMESKRVGRRKFKEAEEDYADLKKKVEDFFGLEFEFRPADRSEYYTKMLGLPDCFVAQDNDLRCLVIVQLWESEYHKNLVNVVNMYNGVSYNAICRNSDNLDVWEISTDENKELKVMLSGVKNHEQLKIFIKGVCEAATK